MLEPIVDHLPQGPPVESFRQTWRESVYTYCWEWLWKYGLLCLEYTINLGYQQLPFEPRDR